MGFEKEVIWDMDLGFCKPGQGAGPHQGKIRQANNFSADFGSGELR